MKAKLFVKGEREPIELEYNEAEAAQKLISDTTKGMDTPFSIEGVWTGTKRDMRFVKFGAKDVGRAYAKSVEPMSKEEAREFEERIVKPFKKVAEEAGRKPHHWAEYWMENIGAIRIRKEGTPEQPYFSLSVLHNGDYDFSLYHDAMGRLESYKEYVGRRDYGIRQGLAEAAKQETEVLANSKKV